MNPHIEIDLEHDSEGEISAKLDMLRTRGMGRHGNEFTRAEAMSKIGKRGKLKKRIPGRLLPGEQPLLVGLQGAVEAVRHSHAGYAVVIKLDLPRPLSLPTEYSLWTLVPLLKSAYQACFQEEREAIPEGLDNQKAPK